MALDYLNNNLEIGDTVIFPASGCFMEGVIEKIRNSNRHMSPNEVFVKNAMGYKKWKASNDVIFKSRNN